MNSDDFWDYENGYWWFSDTSRFAKSLAHAELYKKIINLPGSVAEFGVYKAASLIRWLTLRELFESTNSRNILGFDAFGTFPGDGVSNVSSDSEFIERFEEKGGDGLSEEEVDMILKGKGFAGYSLIAGDVRQTLTQFLEINQAERFC